MGWVRTLGNRCKCANLPTPFTFNQHMIAGRLYQYFAFSLVLFSVSSLHAQTLTLEQAIELTIQHYPTIAAKRAALDAARTNAAVMRESRLPNVRLHDQIDLGTANGMSGSYFSLGLIVPTSGARRGVNRMDLASGNIALASMDWEIYNFGRYKSEDQLARTEAVVGESILEKEKFQLQQLVIGTYLEMLRFGQQLTIEQQNIARIDTARRIITNLVNNGIKAGLDSSLVRVQVSKAQIAYRQVLENYYQAQIRLATLTGKPVNTLKIDTTFRLESSLESLRPTDVSANHPLLKYQESIVRRQSAEIDVIRKAAMPRVSFLAAASARGSSINVENKYGPLPAGLVYSRANVLTGLAITVNLMDFRRVANRIRLQQYRVQEASFQQASEQLQLQNISTTADSVLAVLQHELHDFSSSLRAASDVYQQRLSRYQNGLDNILGLSESLQLLTSVEKDYLAAQHRSVALLLQKAYVTNDFDTFFKLFKHR